MTEEKLQRIQSARRSLAKAKIQWSEFNSGYHFKIGKTDFWPSTGKWIDGNDEGFGIETMLNHIRPKKSGSAKVLTVDQIFDVVKRVYPTNLYKICEAIHKEIYQ